MQSVNNSRIIKGDPILYRPIYAYGERERERERNGKKKQHRPVDPAQEPGHHSRISLRFGSCTTAKEIVTVRRLSSHYPPCGRTRLAARVNDREKSSSIITP